MTATSALLAADVVVGAVLVAASLGRWRTSSGALLLASGGAWWIGGLIPALTFLHRGALIHLVLVHPGGRPAGRAVQVTIAAGYVYACVFPLAGNAAVSLVMAVAVMVMALYRRAVSTEQRRLSTSFALAAAGCLAGAIVVGPICRWFGVGTVATVLATYDVLVVCVALLVMTDMLRMGSARVAMTGLVVDLGQTTGSDVLQQRLAARLGDPTLVVGYWLPETGRYVDDTGRAIELPSPGSGSQVIPLQVDDQPVAVLIHDSGALADPRLLTEVAAAANWAVGNLALGAQVRERVDSVEASTRRIVTAADAERSRLEEKLHQGVVRRLQRVAQLVGSCDGGGLDPLSSDVQRALAEISELARGLHPRILTEHGLSAALRELAGSSPIPVHVDVQATPLPPATEATLYFACSEALTNALKHARPSSVLVRVTTDGEQTHLVVTDDGVGGASTERGTGLRGLSDRVEAHGGILRVDSPPNDGGTRLEVSLPVRPEPAPVASGVP